MGEHEQRAGNTVLDVATMPLAPLEHGEHQRVIEGRCELSVRELDVSEDGRVERGIWQITEGVMEDVEVDELFVVLSGRATIEYLDDGTRFEAHPGCAGISTAGTRTRWTVHEPLRKVYQLTLPAPSGEVAPS